MKYRAYWISGQGDILPVPTIHIDLVAKHPKRFGYTRGSIERIFAAHGEPVGHEGFARQEIMLHLIVNEGWMRVRYTRNNDLWAIELKSFDERTQRIISDFFTMIVGSHAGRLSVRGAAQLHSEVRICELHDGNQVLRHSTTVRELVSGREGITSRSPGSLCARLEDPLVTD